ncbi:hypothetical protein JXB12_07845 [candidate division KSB1 bacterium]|nr:hypothetical protein [candidate division KSB1 bacterium]
MSKSIWSFLIVLSLSFMITDCSRQESKNMLPKDKARDFANVLYNRQLFQQSIDQYVSYLNNYDIDLTEQANINYTVAEIYFERLRDYENALTYYLKIKYLYPESRLVEDVNKKIVACLERLERSEDALQVLEEATSLEPDKVVRKRPGAVVARIGKREITQGDIDFELNQLPPYIRSQFNTKDSKLQFLQNYILTELLYDKAKREELDKNPEIVEAAFQAKKEIMVRKLLEREVANKVNIDMVDVQNYYEANSENYAEKDNAGNVTRRKSFDEVKEQVAQDLALEKQQEILNNMTVQLMRAESAEIYSDKLQ